MSNTENPAFDTAYTLSRKHEIRALAAIDNPEDRSAAADALASKGFTVDPVIDAQGWGPWTTMVMRKLGGLPWIAPLGKPPINLSDLSAGHVLTDLNQVPSYAILTSTDIKDYKPFDPPAPAPPPVLISSDPVHAFANIDDNGDELYFSDPDDRSPLGTVWPTAATSPHWVKSAYRMTPWGLYQRWKKVG